MIGIADAQIWPWNMMAIRPKAVMPHAQQQDMSI
jgi:hypothetical protein